MALVVIGIIGTGIDRREGALLALPFLALIGITQWIYLGPAAWLFRRRGATAVAKGVVIGGGLVALGSTLCYGGLSVMWLQNARVRFDRARVRRGEAQLSRDWHPRL